MGYDEETFPVSELPKPFLTARWENLAMINYEIDQGLLKKFGPAGTELDFFNGKTFVSMVAFQFLATKVKGMVIPFHQDFEEINLRFYVRRKSGDEWRRGVVFVKEIVPKIAIATVARLFYNENYVSMPTRSKVLVTDHSVSASYSWRNGGKWNALAVWGIDSPQSIGAGSETEFITEHYFGYSRQRNGSTVEYRVEHPRWLVWNATGWKFDCDVQGLYGAEFMDTLASKPSSAFIAQGSQVTVRDGRSIKT